MMRYWPLVLCLVFAADATVRAADPPSREELGRSVKLRILVDKVLQPEAKWVTQEWMVKATAEAGFNVLSPRAGFDRLGEVRQVAEWCGKYGIYHMPWMRGSLTAPAGHEADGKRLVWANGNEQPLWSPNSDEFWQWTTRYVVEYAKVSAENKHLMGVFLDYENYAPGRQGNLYSLSYDDVILGKFAQAKGIELPKLELAKRKVWLEEQKLHEAFEQFQVDHWRQRCRALRQAVDQIEPTFQFCIYPAPGTPLMIQAIYPEWSTKKAPLILADPWVYGRPALMMSQPEALERNRQKLLKGMEIAKAAGIPYLYAGGIDPLVRGADPEFCGKNAVMISETTDGYWIFYEGPTYTKQDHADYWKWFTWANRAIAAGNWQAWHEPRETSEDWGLGVWGPKGKLTLTAPEKKEAKDYPRLRLRHDTTLVLGCKAGQPVEVTLGAYRVGNYPPTLVWQLRNPAMETIASAQSAIESKGTVRFTPDRDGLYSLAASGGGSAWSVVRSNVPVGIYARQAVHTIGGADRLYFQVPKDLAKFTLSLRGSGVETARVRVYNPQGTEVATAQTTAQKQDTHVTVRVGDQSDAVWSLAITRADEGPLEDSMLTLDQALTPTLSLVPEEVFRASPAK